MIKANLAVSIRF